MIKAKNNESPLEPRPSRQNKDRQRQNTDVSVKMPESDPKSGNGSTNAGSETLLKILIFATMFLIMATTASAAVYLAKMTAGKEKEASN